MLFTDPCFLFLFLPLVLGLYYLSPRCAKNIVLLIASLFFYAAAEGASTLIILCSIAFNYRAGICIARAGTGSGRKLALAYSISINLLLLIYFKYATFLVENLNFALWHARMARLHLPSIVLPLGISFFTFHAISYLMDIYRRQATPQIHPFRFALYIVLFPQLIAGPIIRYKTICDQLVVGGPHGRRGSISNFARGIRRFIMGLAKKMLIANTLAVAADAIFSQNPRLLSPAAAWLGAVCYTLQIYFDFSGYSDMAIGLGAMFGFVFPENFNYPYAATSITDFWRRWHITLSTWFRDYLYIPLGGNRVRPWRIYFNLITVFFLCGLWHGAMWTFVIWGLFHGFFLIVERAGLLRQLEKHPLLRHLYVLLTITIAWVLFRAPSLHVAAQYLMRMAFLADNSAAITPAAFYLNSLIVTALIAGILLSTPVIPWLAAAWNRLLQHRGRMILLGDVLAGLVQTGTLAGLFLLSAASSASGTYNPFIYFRF